MPLICASQIDGLRRLGLARQVMYRALASFDEQYNMRGPVHLEATTAQLVRYYHLNYGFTLRDLTPELAPEFLVAVNDLRHLSTFLARHRDVFFERAKGFRMILSPEHVYRFLAYSDPLDFDPAVLEERIRGKTIEVLVPEHVHQRIGLRTETINDDEVVGLESNDGQRFELPRALALQLKALTGWIENTRPDHYIPLENVSGAHLQIIVQVLKSEIPFAQLDELDDLTAFQLVHACDYLEYMPMLGFLVTGMGPRLLRVEPEVFEETIDSFPDYFILTACIMNPKNIDALMNRCSTCWSDDIQMHIESLNRRFRAWPFEDFVNMGFIWAAQNGHAMVVRLLLDTPERGINPAADGNNAIVAAAEEGRAAVVRLLLDTPGRGINPAAWSNNAIRGAAYYGHVEVVRLLLAYRNPAHPDYEVDPTVRQHAIIIHAEKVGQTEIVALLKQWYHNHNIELPEQVKACIACRAPATAVCGACRRATYCGAACQARDWTRRDGGHARVCTPMKKP